MIRPSRVKVFVEKAWAQKPVGSQPHEWTFTPRFTTGEVPLDLQINEWLAQTGHKLVSVSPPGVYHYWLDDQHKDKCIVMGITVVYEEALDNGQVTTDHPAAQLLTTGQISVAGPGPDGPIDYEEEQARRQEEAAYDDQARQVQESFGNGCDGNVGGDDSTDHP